MAAVLAPLKNACLASDIGQRHGDTTSILNVKIRTKLILTFVFFVLLLIISTGLTLRSLNNANNGVQLIVDEIYPNTVAANELTDKFNAFIDVQQQVLLDEERRWTQDADKRMEEINVVVRGLLNKFNTELEDDASRKIMAQIMNHRIPYLESRDRVMEAIAKNQHSVALEEMMGTTLKLQDEYQAMVRKLIEIQNLRMADAGKQITMDYQSNRVLVMVMALLSILVALIVGFTLIHSITHPLDQAMEFASAIAEGDLTASITCERQDETGVLLRALMEMKTRLQAIVRDVQISAMHISSAVEQIVAGNQDLAARTEEQASSVEETAASMEQITATVKNTYDNTHEATRLSTDASAVVKHNGEMMAQVTSKMRLINTASTRMSEIINLIDSIAFQTNILALNAAVEAARAGEHGRGFAVVAGEVRQLAQKSASSASEIRSLIESSVDEAQEGMALVESAASHIDGMVAHVDEINVILHEIAQASREQSDGIGQINRAIGLIDTATQQNSSLVEESVAAATSLNKQAHQLKNVVEVFRISDTKA